VIIPCFNEEQTLRVCVERVREIADEDLSLELIIVDDASSDDSVRVAQQLVAEYDDVRLLQHEQNQGKGAALQTGFADATGDYVAVQDADLEYDPRDLKRLLQPLEEDRADVVFGSRFLSRGAHRVLYFWHSLGNKFLTFLSNMFTDLNLTDMETCYKVFRRSVIQSIELKEKRFGFEPEVVAKVAQMRLRIFEMGISYYGRTYEEGKKIGVRDGFRALYCIVRYNAHNAPMPIQFLAYLFIGGIAAAVNLVVFLTMFHNGIQAEVALPVAFVAAALVNYALCVSTLFRHKAKWNSATELVVFLALVGAVLLFDMWMTKTLLAITSAAVAKLTATAIGLILNFAGRRWLVFPEPKRKPWSPSAEGDQAADSE